MEYKNLTPHEIKEVGSGLTFAPQKESARVTVTYIAVDGGVPECDASGPMDFPMPIIYESRYGEVVGLPEAVPGTIYIVSLLVAQACNERPDLVSPGELVRDERGLPVGCRGFVRQ